MRLNYSTPSARFRPKTSKKTRAADCSSTSQTKGYSTLCDLRSLCRSNVIHPEQATAGAPEQQLTSVAVRRPYRVKVQILHGLDLINPCIRHSCANAFLPMAVVSVNDQKEQQQSCAASHHGRNHTLWKTSALEFQAETRLLEFGQPQLDNSFSVQITLSTTCAHRGCEAKVAYVGTTGELRMVVKDEEYDVTRFFPVWRELSPNSSIGPYAVGKLKLRIRFEPTRDSTPALLPPATQPPTRLPFLPANFGDALNLKRKQLKNSVAPEHNSLATTTQLQLHPLEFDATASEKIMREIERDAVLVNFAPDQVEFVKPIGEGIHSCVYHGHWVHSAEGQQITRDIAIKEFRYVNSFPPPNVLATFRHEYQLLELCARENACNVVRYLGVLLRPRPAIITEFFPCGSLAACMKDGPTWSQVSLVKIAQALDWLHRHDIIHRDIKCHNILLDRLGSDSPTAKLCDVGSAIIRQASDPLPREEVGSSGYTAPEVFTDEGYTCKVDVWSFGIVLWEVLTGFESKSEETTKKNEIRNPFVGLAGEQCVELARQGMRPACCGGNHAFVQELLEKCWAFEPKERPSIGEIVNELQVVCQKLALQSM